MNSFPSKLLLFGEYTIIQGSQALAIPFSSYKGEWQYGGEPYDLAILARYLIDLESKGELLAPLDLGAFKTALSKGLSFESNIPSGYGLGSSGAVCAAIYQVFKTDAGFSDIVELKQLLAQIESFFHGSSSGIDPLVSYLKKGIWIKSKTEIEAIEATNLEELKKSFFLIDTKLSRSTAPLVEYFKTEYATNTVFQNTVGAKLIPYTHQAIAAFLENKPVALFENIHQISTLQYRHFQKMIPLAFREVWQKGLDSDMFKLKLCGAGGGGFILGFTKDYEQLKDKFTAYSIQKITKDILPFQGMQRIF